MKYRFFVLGMLLSIFLASTVVAQLPAPTNLTATFEQQGTVRGDVKLEWQMTAGQWMFKVYRSANDTAHYRPVAHVRDRVYRDYNIHAGTRYYYFVRAFAQNTISPEGPRSNVVDILVPIPPPPVRGFIAGTVTDDSTGAPLARVQMRFYRTLNMWSHSPEVVTDSLGHYRAVLDTGSYLVRAEPRCASATGGYYAEYFDNVREPRLATPVAVGDSTTFIANFGLARIVPPTFSFVSGQVTDTTGVPIRRSSVALLRTLQGMNALSANGWTFNDERDELEGLGHTRGVMWHGVTDSNGNYRARVIAGRYIAVASKQAYIPEYFNNQPTALLANVINASQDTGGVNFSLAPKPIPQNSVAGIVRDSAGTRVPSRVVLFPTRLSHPSGVSVRYGHTDSLGAYTLSNIPEGKYFVFVVPFHDYAPAYYKAGEYGIRRRENADTVTIVGNVTGIDVGVMAVQHNGVARVGGFIRATSNIPLAGVSVIAMNADGEIAGVGTTEANGAYAIDAVASGDVQLTADRDGYASALSSVTISPSTYSVANVNMTMSPAGLTSVNGGTEGPAVFALAQNYPNPFNPSTKISFTLAAPGFTTLEVFNLIGQKVATLAHENLPANSYSFTFDAKGFSSGMYFYKLSSGSFVETRKMLLLK